MKTVRDKLEGLPSINYLTLFQNKDRVKILEGVLEFSGITNFKGHQFDLFKYCVQRFEGPRVFDMTDHAKGCLASHLLTIKKWLIDTDEPYTLICEDDFSIETVPYWNFTWKEFFDYLPQDWECVQLVQIQEVAYRKMKIHERGLYDWSTCCYLIKREYAERLIEKTINGGIFTLTHDRSAVAAEMVIYEAPIGKVYSFPLFVENTYLGTSAKLTDDYNHSVHDQTRKIHRRCHLHILDWWKTEGINTPIREIQL